MMIVHAVRQYPPGIGGMENFVTMLAEGQARAGHDVRVVTLDRIFGNQDRLPAVERRGGVEIVRIPFMGSRRYPIAPTVLKHLRDAAIVHVHGLEFFADFLGWTRLLHRRPLVLSTHGGFFHTTFAQTLKRFWFNTITRATLQSYDAVIACSTQDEETFRAVASDKTVLVENGVDTDKFAGLANARAKTMIYFGRLAPNKGLLRLLRWFAGLVAIAPDWRLIVAGMEMGVTIDQLREVAAFYGIEESVEFHAAPDDKELAALIARSSVYACASTYEGFGIAAVEGIAAGLYPLLSDIPAFRRTIERIGYGTCTSFETTDDITTFLAELQAFVGDAIDNATLRDRLSPFGWDRALEKIETLYRQVRVSPRKRAGGVEPAIETPGGPPVRTAPR